jgi:hypothetical protein
MLNKSYRETDTGYKTLCWIWILSKDSKGYAQMWDKNYQKLRRGHRVFYEQAFGPTEFQLDHLCRVRDCVNPDHLEPVTNAVNTQRGARAKLDPSVIESIFSMYADGATQRQIGDSLGVHNGTISRVLAKKRWGNVISIRSDA